MINSHKKTHITQHGNTTFSVIAIAIIAILIGLFVQKGINKPAVLPEFSKTIILPSAKNIKHTRFTDHNGNAFDKAQFTGKWSIVFFGFTNCPDICPTTLQTLKQVKTNLQEKQLWANYQVVMVTVDPETDTSKRLANYVPYFDSEFIGLSADINTTEQFAKQLGILFVKRERDNGSNYEVDHSASIILINPEGQWAGVIGAPHKADSISADLTKLARFFGTKEATTKQHKAEQKTTQQANQINIKSNEQPTLNLSKAWIRPAPPTANAMAAYFEIQNNTNKDIQIVDSNSETFDLTMIHNTVIENGVARMEHMDGLTVPANSKVTLAPLSTHMMLMRPERPLNEGDFVNITLIDENDEEYDYKIEVRQDPTQIN